jgi:hypothetical protein
MTKFKFLGAAALLSALIATPTLAQPMNQEPGLYAFYHPNGDPNAGTPGPAEAMAMVPRREVVMKMKMRAQPAHARR